MLDLQRVSLLSLIGEYGSPQEVAAQWTEAQRLMQRVGRGFLSPEKVEQVLTSSQETLGVSCTEGERHFLKVLGQELVRTHEALQAIEHQIERQVEADPILRRMAKVAGKTTSLVLAVTQGTPLDYPDPPSDLKALGLNLKERSSGKHQGPLNITQRGPGKARRSLYFTALRWSYKEAVIGAWYRNKVKRDGSRKGKAIIAIMRKRALSLWYVARGEVFDSRKRFNARSLGMAM